MASKDLSALLDHLDFLIEVRRVPMAKIDSNLCYYLGLLYRKPDKKQTAYISGSGFSDREAINACIGEGIERYCFVNYDFESLPILSWKDLKNGGKTALHPASLPRYSSTQYETPGFPCVPLKEETRVRWIEGYSLTTNRSIWLPAQYVASTDEYGDEPKIFSSNSTGFACGQSQEEAVLTGLYEAIERDAFMLMWLRKHSMPLVDLNSENDPAHPLAVLFKEHFQQPSLDYKIVNLTHDLEIPVFTALILRHEDGEGPLFSIGAACRLNSDQAIKKAMLEAGNMRSVNWWHRYDKNSKHRFENPAKVILEEMKDFGDHLNIAQDPEYFSHCSFMWASDCKQALTSLPQLSANDPVQDLNYCLKIFKDRGDEAIVIDQNIEEIRRFGLSVVKVFVPGLQPLHVGWKTEPLESPRLRKLAVSEVLLNRFPHPFP